MAKSINLDAMIKREDLDVTDTDPAQVQIGAVIKLNELEATSLTFNVLRKPDFQRETANWDSEKVANLIQSFLDGDLIPSVIVWRSNKTGKLFIIDGAHRLSALIAWINDDYGDQQISRAFFGNDIDAPQIKLAEKTRKLINDRIGSYQRLKEYVIKPEGAPSQEALVRARNIASFVINLQDVKGDVANAERSFLRINQSATPIHTTELVIIQSRKKGNAIAARALLRGGAGHAHWATFEHTQKQQILSLASEIYQNLFKPILEYPIRTLALPAAGQALTPDSLDLVFHLVNYVNSITEASTKSVPVKWRIKSKDGKSDVDLEDDKTGDQTVKFLQAVKEWTEGVFGKAKGSLALHPGVYCYGATGRFQPTAFFAAITLVQYLEVHKKFDAFIEVRAKFEEFVLGHRLFINQIVGSYGSQLKGLPALSKMYQIIFSNIATKSTAEVVTAIQADPELSFVREISDDDRKYGRNFSRETNNAIYLRQALEKELTCGICGARIHSKMITMDHKTRKAEGGMGSPENGQLAHPYCNDGYKEKAAHAKSV